MKLDLSCPSSARWLSEQVAMATAHLGAEYVVMDAGEGSPPEKDSVAAGEYLRQLGQIAAKAGDTTILTSASGYLDMSTLHSKYCPHHHTTDSCVLCAFLVHITPSSSSIKEILTPQTKHHAKVLKKAASPLDFFCVSVLRSSELGLFVRMPALQADWSYFGLKGIIPAVLLHSLMGYPFFIPDAVGTDFSHPSPSCFRVCLRSITRVAGAPNTFTLFHFMQSAQSHDWRSFPSS